MQARSAKPSTATEDGEQNARQAGDKRNSCTTRKPNFQASKLPNFHSPLHPRHVCDVPRGSPVGRIGPIGHIGRGSPFPKAWRAKPAMLPQAPGPDVRLARTHGPPLASLSLRVLSHGRFGPLGLHGNFQSIWQSAGGSRPLIGSNRRNRRFLLRVSSWSFVFFVSAPQGKSSTPSHRSARRSAGAFCSLFSVLCSPGRVCARLSFTALFWYHLP